MSTVSAWSNRYDVFMDSENDEWEPIENIVPKKEHSTKNQKLSNLKAGKPTAKEGEKSKTNKSENIEALQISPKTGDQKYPSKNEEKTKSSDNSGGMRPQNDDRACFNCNGVGHLARVCPEKTNARNADERNTDSANRGCFKCSETGHIARNCTNSDSSKSFSGNPMKDMDCYKCGENGHMARDCSSATDIRSNDTRRNIQEPECYNCNNVGHLARNCTSAKSGRDNKCYQCSEEGHIARNCPTSNDNYKPQERQEDTENNSEVVLENDAPDTVASPDMNENPPSEVEEANYTLDEWKSLQGNKLEPKFNIRKPGEGSEIDPKWKKTTVYKKEKESFNEEDDEENEIYLQRAHRQKKIVDIVYNFTDTSGGATNGRGRGRGGRQGRGGRGFSNAGRGGRNINGPTLDVMDQHSFPSLG